MSFLVGADHQSVFRGIEIEYNNIDQLLLELRIITQFEGAALVWLEAGDLPHPMHHGRAGSDFLSHRTHGPVRGGGWFCLSGFADDFRSQLVAPNGLATATRQVLEDTFEAVLKIAIAPESGGPSVDVKLDADFIIAEMGRRKENNPSALGDTDLCPFAGGQSLQLLVLFSAQNDFLGFPHGRPPYYKVGQQGTILSSLKFETLH